MPSSRRLRRPPAEPKRRSGSIKQPVDDQARRTGVVRAAVFDECLARIAVDAEVVVHAAAHTILRATGGEFISLSDPPGPLRALAATCRNIGTWPVLAGEDGARDTLLSSPIIVSDFPSIAPESPGDFFDGTEMDELLTLSILTLSDDEKRQMREVDPRARAMLSLRILTLTDEEKREMTASDERARRLLERTEAFSSEQLMRMHGTLRQIRALEEAP